jgi:hypothetical protein
MTSSSTGIVQTSRLITNAVIVQRGFPLAFRGELT